jgi:hypothetical protein
MLRGQDSAKRLPKEHWILLSRLLNKLEKDREMEIITALEGVLFALVLAAIAVSPNAISTYLELRAQKDAFESEE